MAGRKDIYKDAKSGFDKNPQNINRKGQPPKLFTLLKREGYSPVQIRDGLKEIAFYDLPQIKKLIADDSAPIIYRIIANQYLHCLKNNDWNKIREIMEHVLGKPQQSVDLVGKVETEQKHAVIFIDATKKEQ